MHFQTVVRRITRMDKLVDYSKCKLQNLNLITSSITSLKLPVLLAENLDNVRLHSRIRCQNPTNTIQKTYLNLFFFNQILTFRSFELIINSKALDV